MVVTFPRAGHKVEIISSGLIDHPTRAPDSFNTVLHTHSAQELFLLNTQFLQTPANITTRVFGVREQWYIARETSSGLFSSSILLHPFSSHITACHTSTLPPFSVLPGWYSSLSFPLLSVFNLLFHACFTFPPIPLSVHLFSVSSFSLLLSSFLHPVAVHIAFCKQHSVCPRQ